MPGLAASPYSAWSGHVSLMIEHESLQVFATASEDMDALTFATPKLIRNLLSPVKRTVPAIEYDYDKASHPGAARAL